MVRYFFDSYAVIEMIDGNPNYAKYAQMPIVITLFNLAEIYSFCLREYGESRCNKTFAFLKPCVVEVDDETLKQAMKFRNKEKSKRLSYADCIGYIYALRKKLVFLTGDKQFKNMKGVQFVK